MHATVLLTLGFSASQALAIIDSDGNGVSDLWEQMNPTLALEDDTDSDGFSNKLEAIAGTDPTARASRPEFASMELDPTTGNLRLSWQQTVGKRYQVETFDPATGSWSFTFSAVAVDDSIYNATLGASEDVAILRLRIFDVDQDGDGLSSWEENQLGYSDVQMRSSGNAGEGDFISAFRSLEGTGTLTLPNGQTIPQRPTPRNEATRFLVQSSFGPDPALIDEVVSLGISGWMDQQLNPTFLTETRLTMVGQGNAFPLLWGMGWWKAAMTSPDQLRLRMGNALSQILVVSVTGNDLIRGNSFTQADYYDILLEHSLGNYRDLLEDVTYSTQMGFYLSHLQNRKADPALNRFPDENFAREIMQLFTIGLWELNQDGTRKLDSLGEPIPSYDNETIQEMAKIFTGFGFGGPSGTSFFAPVGGNDFVYPMKMYDEEHEPGIKNIVNGVTIPSGQTGIEDISDTLDALCEHPNIGPFISRLLIQRFTSSNPSPLYVNRVAAAWEDDGSGTKGNLKAVLNAILMDPEARNIAAKGDVSGKVREPFLRMVALVRAFTARNERTPATFPVFPGFYTAEFGQMPLSAPSVFNFYLPDHSPAGELRDRGLFSPELEIATADRLIRVDNRLDQIIQSGLIPAGSQAADYIKCDFSALVPLSNDSTSVPALVDYLDDLLTWGSLSASSRAAIIQATQAQTTSATRIITAVHLIAESPDFVVLK